MKKRWIVFIFIIFLMLFLSSCAKKSQPLKKPAIPKIPDDISQGEKKEPVLKVYEIQTDSIKEMKLEEYVTGVVAGEMENNWPIEALATQAILARTYVLEFITDKGGSKYADAHISTDFEEAQAWNPENINERVKKAIDMTRGQVVVHKGNYIKAWFHSHAGGMTATAKEGLDFKEKEPAYIQVVKSPDTDAGPPDKKEWSATFSKDEVDQAVREMGMEAGTIDDVSIEERGPSGRATKLKIGDAVVSASDFRIALGSTDMRSTLLTSFRVEGNDVIMAGKGFGHGVGLSQWGAKVMAKQGKKPEDIIHYYFKDVDIVKLWD